ncbi:hypothetical protein A3G63_02740 [Candidatus Kaiserbacteria bacterium RIFCSPLOWO2_12_FULL_52_8]|uniref:DUF5673 domain-containing protein n=1 Tax=Candidatus Kaiserbacteria bacterium RIFCSPHIGHO2_01_FULL_53_31 TaxID=1798481 RepID=A0A1F6CGV2_9BACT|nr:MAG: hypothetical protein A2678_02880 [Candidatus Kaiserbacteria bacterium RIFCSPHIGHO2_01_FULL_53_31]OGG92588.1 MAG: hypothetical protein A3G63_02740 [Candidatus Kaiserbacteria bacterium RIFCSPLOWO2_12_FULL_52_8]
MSRAAIFEWEGREYTHGPKSADWYWALGIIAVASTTASILFGNYLLTVLIVVAAITLALHGAKHPPLHRFRIVEQGLAIGDELYPFDNMISFAILEDVEDEFPPLLSVKNESWLSPHLMIPLEGVNADMIYEYFLHHVDEGKHEHSFSDLVAAWLGF